MRYPAVGGSSFSTGFEAPVIRFATGILAEVLLQVRVCSHCPFAGAVQGVRRGTCKLLKTQTMQSSQMDAQST